MDKPFLAFYVLAAALFSFSTRAGAVLLNPSGDSYNMVSLVATSAGATTAATGNNLSLRSSMPINSGGNPLTAGNYTFSSGFMPQSLVKFAAKGVGQAHAYPVPWRKTLDSGFPITFTDLPPQARVRIFTLTGRLVRELNKNDPGSQLLWDLRNANGQEAFSGVYFFLVKDPTTGETRKGKLMIIR